MSEGALNWQIVAREGEARARVLQARRAGQRRAVEIA